MLTYILPMLVFGGIGLAAGILLTVCSKLFEVKTDERVEAVNEVLPQVNCGSCGFSGCADYAAAIVKNGVPTNMCKPGGADCAKKIAAIMGMEEMAVKPQVAVVLCSGDCNATESKYVFQGVQSCKAANRFYNGSEVCTHGCLGFGDCAAACPQDAIIVRDGLARVDKSKCIGCGICAKVCPDNLIVLRDIDKKIDVCCSSTDIGRIVRSVCKSGCIGCKMCEKKCEHGAIRVVNNLARIDYEKCVACGECADVCPTKAIRKCDTVYKWNGDKIEAAISGSASERSAEKPENTAEKTEKKAEDKPAAKTEKPAPKTAEKTAEKAEQKPAQKPAVKNGQKPAAKNVSQNSTQKSSDRNAPKKTYPSSSSKGKKKKKKK